MDHSDTDELRTAVIETIDRVLNEADGIRLEHEYLLGEINNLFDRCYVETASQEVHIIPVQ